jgi:hypothetical protein
MGFGSYALMAMSLSPPRNGRTSEAISPVWFGNSSIYADCSFGRLLEKSCMRRAQKLCVKLCVEIMRQTHKSQYPMPSFDTEGLLGIEAGGARGGHPNGEKGNQA